MVKNGQLVIGVDIDDVLADFFGRHDETTGLIGFHNETYTKPPHNLARLKYSEISHFYLSKTLGIPIEFAKRMIREFYQAPRFSSLASTPGSHEVMRALSEKYILLSITSRPERIKRLTVDFLSQFTTNQGNPIFTGDRIFFTDWEETNKEGKDKRNMADGSKVDVCLSQSVDYIIEDSPLHAKDLSAAGINVLLIETPYNKNYTFDGPGKVHSFKNLYGVAHFLGVAIPTLESTTKERHLKKIH